MKESAPDRPALNVMVSAKSVRLYGNRAFFRFLREELAHLIECPSGAYCEFQTISLVGERPGLDYKPHYKVLLAREDDDSFQTARELDAEEFDVVLMTVEEDDIR